MIVDDHDAIRTGITFAFRDSAEFVVVGEAANAAQALALVQEKDPAIVILDISLPDRNGIDTAADIIRTTGNRTRIVFYTMHEERGWLASMEKIGAAACVLKGEPLASLISTLRQVRDGGSRFPRFLAGAGPSEEAPRSSDTDEYQKLSRREREIFVMLANGRTVKEAAFDLGLSPKTVETYKYRLMRKMNAQSVIDLAKLAIRGHLVKP